MKTFRLFTVENGRISEGASVQSLRLSSGVEIPAILIGEDGRGRSLGVLPVSGCLAGQVLHTATISQTQAGRPKLIAASGTPSEDEIILVVRTGIGFRGGNAHTGDYAGVEAAEDWYGDVRFDGNGYIEWQSRYAKMPGAMLVSGQIAEGAAGRMGCGDQYVLILQKDQVLRTARYGRLYGEPSTHFVKWDGEKLLTATEEERDLTDCF